MSPALKVVAPGAHTTVQDFGRFGYQQLGVPVSGALDSESLRLANALVRNPPDMAGLEILYQGPTLEVTAESARVAISGFGAMIQVLSDTVYNIGPWASVLLKRGQIFRITLDGTVSSCYLACEGGFDLPVCLNSFSTYVRGKLGGFHGRPLKIGDELRLKIKTSPEGEDLRLPKPPDFSQEQSIRITWGLQHDMFKEESQQSFLNEPFTILPESDRMGYRIDGPKLYHRDSYDIVSDGIATGAIQVPGNGQPIILLADHQTTGGYPKIATVISADIPALGRLRPGDTINFSVVTIEEAEKIRRHKEEAINMLVNNIKPANPVIQIDLKVLYSTNLISGVVGPEHEGH